MLSRVFFCHSVIKLSCLYIMLMRLFHCYRHYSIGEIMSDEPNKAIALHGAEDMRRLIIDAAATGSMYGALISPEEYKMFIERGTGAGLNPIHADRAIREAIGELVADNVPLEAGTIIPNISERLDGILKRRKAMMGGERTYSFDFSVAPF